MKKRITTDEWIEEATKYHNGKFVYDEVVYTGEYNEVAIICRDHGRFYQTPYAHMRSVYACRSCMGGFNGHHSTINKWAKDHECYNLQERNTKAFKTKMFQPYMKSTLQMEVQEGERLMIESFMNSTNKIGHTMHYTNIFNISHKGKNPMNYDSGDQAYDLYPRYKKKNNTTMEAVINIKHVKIDKNLLQTNIFHSLYGWKNELNPGDKLVSVTISDKNNSLDKWTEELPIELSTDQMKSLPSFIPLQMANEISDMKFFDMILDGKIAMIYPSKTFENDLAMVLDI